MAGWLSPPVMEKGNLEVGKRASALVLQMEPTAEKMCISIGRGNLMGPDWMGLAPPALRDYFAPDALDAVYLDPVHCLHFERTARTMETYLVKFDSLRRTAEGCMQSGGTSPEAPVAALR